jgi:uncharacterized RDD family membrane protein YckC
MESNVENTEVESPIKVIYGGFWERFGALFLDGIAYGLITIPLTLFNTFTWKNQLINVLIFLIGICYKPFCEYKWGRTLGKLALNLKVVNMDLQKPNGIEILKRNSFNIANSIFSFIIVYIMFNNQDFHNVTTFKEYMKFSKENRDVISTLINFLFFTLLIVDVCFMIDDTQRKTLHDRFGKTFVIKRK